MDKTEKVSAKTYNDIGNKAFLFKNYAEAIRQYSLAIQMEGNHCEYYSSRANAYFEAEKYQECIEDCDSSIRINS